MRKALYVLGALVFVLGLSQFAFPEWWMQRLSEWVDATWFAWLGLLAVAFGALVVIGALMHLMALRRFFLVLGLLTLIIGGVILVNPAMMRDFYYAAYLHRSSGYQFVATRAAGLLRIAIGLVIIYAVIKAPRKEPEPPPGRLMPRWNTGGSKVVM